MLDHTFLLFHLGDTYFFFNELVKAQATNYAENEIFKNYLMHKRSTERYYGRMYVGAITIPYFILLFGRTKIIQKLALGYVVFSLLDALYDMGVYTYFFLHGPGHMKKILELPPYESFGSVQTRLFMRYCAS